MTNTPPETAWGYCGGKVCPPGAVPDLPPGFVKYRIAGYNRLETASKLISQRAATGPIGGPDTVFVVAATDGFDAALVASVMAPGSYIVPVSPTGSIPVHMQDAIYDMTGITRVIVVGGPGAVSEEAFLDVVEHVARGALPGA